MVLKSLTRNQNILNVTFLKLLFNLETLSGHDFHTDALQFLLFLLNNSNKSANLIFFLSIFRWVHVVCALYVPGVAFGDIDKLRPVTLTEMNYSKYGAKASIPVDCSCWFRFTDMFNILPGATLVYPACVSKYIG